MASLLLMALVVINIFNKFAFANLVSQQTAYFHVIGDFGRFSRSLIIMIF